MIDGNTELSFDRRLEYLRENVFTKETWKADKQNHVLPFFTITRLLS